MDWIEILNWTIIRIAKTIGREDLGRIRYILIKLIAGIWLRVKEKVWIIGIEDFGIRSRVNGKRTYGSIK